MNFNKVIDDFVNTIKTSQEFMDLKLAKKQLSQFKDLQRQIESFQKDQQELFSLTQSGGDMKAKIMELNQKFQSFSNNPEVMRLIDKQKNFNDLVMNIFQKVNEKLDREFRK